MIKKPYQVSKDNIKKTKFYLFHGINEGAKEEKISELLLNVKKENIFKYEENSILNDCDDLFDQILNKSLFEEEKVIIIKKSTDKIFRVINDLFDIKLEDITIILVSHLLEKKSKLRNLFEKDKNLICMPFYEDTDESLSIITRDFLKKKNIYISQHDINLIVNKCNGDRAILKNELNKIYLYSINGKKIDTENLTKLINLIENYSILELINNCLAKNKIKTIKILNENNYAYDDCILISRTFLSKLKKILILSNEYKNNKNIDLTISSAKPPIFWKDKEITKQQIQKWEPEKIKDTIYKLNKIETLIKKNINNSVKIITDFIIEQSRIEVNN